MQTIYSRTIEKPCGWLFARWSAGAKAFELSLPPEKRVINDPLAPFYAGEIGMNMVKAAMAINPAIRKAIVLRARYMDDYTKKCLADGYGQVVLLGAGYDSRYLRIDECRQIRVFELDLESTQVIKKSLTRRLLGKLPGNVTYVSLDFSKDSISQKLVAAGFQRQVKSLFIWEGVTLFLNQDIIAETLGRITELGPHHRITFDFVPPELVDDETEYQGNRQLLQWCAAIQEPLTFGSQPEKMSALLTDLGYGNVNVVSMREANKQYSGTEKIEDSYYFATAETGGNGISQSGGLILPASCSKRADNQELAN
jgi:methyltransferase (TIGR00027 family)